MSVVTCSDSPSGPGTTFPRRATLAFAPRFSAAAQRALDILAAAAFDVQIDRVQIVILRSPTDTVANTTVMFPADQDQMSVNVTVTAVPGEILGADLYYKVGETLVLFQGHVTVTVQPPGSAGNPPEIPIVFVGPGATAARLTIAPAGGTFTSVAPVAFTHQVFDAAGASLSGVPVAWSTSDATVATIGTTGVLQFTGKRGTVDVIAQIATPLSARATLTFVPPPAQLVVVSGGGQTGPVGSLLAQPFVVEARAADGSPVAGQTIIFTASNGSAAPASAVTGADGRGQTAMTLGSAAGIATFTAQLGTLSASVTGTATAVASQLRFTVPPIDTDERIVLPAVVVALTDAGGNTVTTATNAVTLTLNGGTAGAVLGGTITVTPVSGVARFTDLTVDRAGTSYTLVASAGGLTGVTSAPFTITPGGPATLTITPAGGTITALGDLLSLSATVRARNGDVLAVAPTWSSSDPGVASVGAADGIVLARANGTTTITATASPATSSVMVVVRQVADTVLTSRDTLSLAFGGTGTVTATALDRNRNVIADAVPLWASENTSIATVTQGGVITLVSSGLTGVTATVDARAGRVVVRQGTPDVPIVAGLGYIRITPGGGTIRMGVSAQLVAELVDAAGVARTITPQWATSQPGRAPVSASGLLAPVDTTTVTITATQNGIAGHAVFTVLPAPTLSSFSFAPTALSGVSTSPVRFSVTIGGSNPGSGVGAVEIEFTGPGGVTRSCRATVPTIGTPSRGSWDCAITLPAGSPSGSWHATRLTLAGSVTRNYTESELAAFGTTVLTVTP